MEYTRTQARRALAGIVEIKDRELKYWIELGIIQFSGGGGKGHHRKLTHYNLVDVALTKRLLDAGLNLKAIKLAIDKFREGNRIRYFFIAMGRQIVRVANPGSESVSVDVVGMLEGKGSTLGLDMKKAQSFFVIDVTDTISKVMAL